MKGTFEVEREQQSAGSEETRGVLRDWAASSGNEEPNFAVMPLTMSASLPSIQFFTLIYNNWIETSNFKCMIGEIRTKWKAITNCVSWLHEALLSTAFTAAKNDRMRNATAGKGEKHENHGIIESNSGELIERENDLDWC